jgi:hypothetical protein
MAASDRMNSHRAGSTVLLAGGVFLVFAGLSSALGFSTSAMVASAAAITALLYAGGVWFSEAPREDYTILLFTPALVIANGPLAGRPVADAYPESIRRELESRCRAALDGRPSHFSCAPGHEFEATPVRSADGTVMFGLLLSGSLAQSRAAQFTSVA